MKGIQLGHLAKAADTGVYDETIRLGHAVRRLGAENRLPLLDMAMPALRQLSAGQYGLFKENIRVLIEADGKLSLFEWALQKILFHHLEGQFTGHSGRQAKKTTLQKSAGACSMLLSLLVYSSRHDGINYDEVFAGGARELPVANVHLLGRGDLSFGRLDRAIDELGGLKPLEKPQLLMACGACVMADRKINPVEAELVRAIADTLDCPMPPLLV